MLTFLRRFLNGELAAAGPATRYRQIKDEVTRLDLAMARVAAADVLADSAVIEEYEPRGPIPAPLPLAELTASFLQEHGYFRTVSDDILVDRSTAQRWEPHPAWIVLGRSPSGILLVVRANGSELCETEGDSEDDLLREAFPTIFHWIAWLGRKNAEASNHSADSEQ